ncbi:MAG: glycosyltransferase family 39 protein [Dehalococcoidia bacterium]|nr:glycosyltransferase family 39 protein [Dehalococcoidia bacterium]
MTALNVLVRVRQSVSQAMSPAPEIRFQAASPPPVSRTTPWRRVQPHLPLIVLLMSLTAVAIIRYITVAQYIDMGPDIANYLTTMNTFFGHDVAGTGLLRPPLIAIPLKVLTLAFGDLTGVKLLGVLISVAIGLPFFLIARRVSYPWIAVAVTILFVLTPPYSNMLSWGYITMFGIFFTVQAIYFFLSILESPTWRNSVLAGLCTSLVFGFHQLTAALFVPLFSFLVLALLLFDRNRLAKNVVPFAAGVAVAVILSLPYIPVYLHLLDMQSSQGGEAGLSTAPFLQFASGVWYLRWLWAVVLGLLLGLASLAWLRRYDRSMAILLGVLLVVPLCLTIFTLQPPFVELNRRAQYFLYVPVWAITGFALSLLWSWRPLVLRRQSGHLLRLATCCIVLYLLVAGGVMSQRALRRGLDFYSYLDDSRWAVVQWIERNVPADATIAAYPENLGWWIEGAARRAVLEVTERSMEANIVEKQRSFAAEQVLSRNRGLYNGNMRLATSYPYINAPGTPVIGFYVGGRYQDLLMFTDTETTVEVKEGGAFPLASVGAPQFAVLGDGASMRMVTTYPLGGATISQTAVLDEGTQTALIIYDVQDVGQTLTHLRLPVVFCHEPASISADNDQFKVVQELETPFSGVVPVTTLFSVSATGAVMGTPSVLEGRICLDFDIVSPDARIMLTFDISCTTAPAAREEVRPYDVPQIIRDRNIGFLTVDFRPDSPIWNDLPRGLEEWFDTCPYYELAHSESDVRIYEVNIGALP